MDVADTPLTVSISEFKANCLRLSADVARTGRKLVVTRYGKPLIEVGPAAEPRSLAGSVAFLCSNAELMAPIGVEWDAAR